VESEDLKNTNETCDFFSHYEASPLHKKPSPIHMISIYDMEPPVKRLPLEMEEIPVGLPPLALNRNISTPPISSPLLISSPILSPHVSAPLSQQQRPNFSLRPTMLSEANSMMMEVLLSPVSLTASNRTFLERSGPFMQQQQQQQSNSMSLV